MSYHGNRQIRGTTNRRTFLLTAATVGTVGFAGCLGDDDENGEDHNGDPGNGDHEHDVDHELGHPEEMVHVEMMSMEGKEHFIPHVVHIEVGGTVMWELVDDLEEHDTTSYHPLYNKPLRLSDEDEHWQSPEIGTQGETWSRTFEVEGVYDYFCTPHWEDDMIGRVIVGWPHPDPEEHPALTEPGDDLDPVEQEMISMFNEQTFPVLEDGGH